MTERGEALNKLRDETFLRIIAGTAPIEEFDNYVYDWKRLGGDAITQEVNAWYAAQK
jgi:putative aldouronate transport system substrate-binding protein